MGLALLLRHQGHGGKGADVHDHVQFIGALGAAFMVCHQYLGTPRSVEPRGTQCGSYLGPSFSADQIRTVLDRFGARYEKLADEEIPGRVARLIADQKVIGWFQGRMEFGPRALGARSILGDARSEEMQTTMNLKIKYRESFRPFAPAVLAERVSEFFEHEGDSPYMLIVAPVREGLRTPVSEEQERLFGIDKLKVPRSSLPAITHVDDSARIQTAHRDTNPRFHQLLTEFKALTAYGLLINTSFNDFFNYIRI